MKKNRKKSPKALATLDDLVRFTSLVVKLLSIAVVLNEKFNHLF